MYRVFRKLSFLNLPGFLWCEAIRIPAFSILKKGAGFQLLIISRSSLSGKGGFFRFRSKLPASEKGRRRIWRLKVKNPNQTSSKSMRTIPEHRDHTGPPGFAEKPICRASPLCEGCPFPSHGFLCQGGDGECMRTRLMKLSETEKTK